MYVLLTGATGFVGSRMVRYLLSQGHTVAALVRPETAPDAVQRLREAGVHPFGDLAPALQACDAVVHLAAVTRAICARDFHRANADGTRALLHAAATLDTPPTVVVCSSLAAAGPSTLARPRTESDTPAPVSHYGCSKLAAEEVAHAYAARVPSVIVRPPAVYGPGDPALLPTLAAMIRAGIGVRPAGSPRYCLIHVDDLCTALILALTVGRRLDPLDRQSGVYQVCDGSPRSFPEICDDLARALGRRAPRLVPLPRPVLMAVSTLIETASRPVGIQPVLGRDKARELNQAAWTCANDRARTELGFTPQRTVLSHELAALC
ncbi:NAD-dependent epimerase/dehydratase family protein [Streptomyces yerevanensis]|uniref:NAD-dependent epimerase/dehydratase family protein n=1 Tax=Streptomyces yerevanensis TaxID=66378 RepID=UPI0005241A1F|nr:NAD(P)-dependent oxidoreductase [Streptomyces yerevanensis]